MEIVLVIVIGVGLVLLLGLYMAWRLIYRFFGGATIAAFEMLREGEEATRDIDDDDEEGHDEPLPFDLKGEVAKDALDFEQAVDRERLEEATDDDPEGHDADPDEPYVAEEHSGVLPKGNSIYGRRFRDGRYRRVSGGTPGRKTDQDFRRPGD